MQETKPSGIFTMCLVDFLSSFGDFEIKIDDKVFLLQIRNMENKFCDMWEFDFFESKNYYYK